MALYKKLKISHNLHRFSHNRFLFVIAGMQRGAIYVVHDGVLEKFCDIFVHKPSFSDRESFFARLGKGQFFGTGGTYRDTRPQLEQDFRTELLEALERAFARSAASIICISAPKQLFSEIRLALPDFLRQRIKYHLEGNYARHHPLTVLEKLTEGKKVTKF